MKTYSAVEKLAIRRAHPISIIFNLIGLMWMVYFVWLNLWLEAILAIMVAKLLCMFFVTGVDYEQLGMSTLGKLALLHLHPANIILQGVGFVGAVYALWLHQSVGVMAGLSLLGLGHAWGWGDVGSCFALQGPFAKFWNVYWAAQD